MKYINKLFVIVLFTVISIEKADAMTKMYLFSEVKGVVLKQGIPVEGAVVEQEFRWAWKDEVGRGQTKTDIAGKFSFPVVMRSSFLGSLLPHEPMVKQTILIKYEGQVYKAWMFDKGDYRENGELNGKAISLYCDLTAPLSHKDNIYGICQLR